MNQPKVPKFFSGSAKIGLCVLALVFPFISVALVDELGLHLGISLGIWLFATFCFWFLSILIGLFIFFVGTNVCFSNRSHVSLVLAFAHALWRIFEAPPTLEEARMSAGLSANPPMIMQQPAYQMAYPEQQYPMAGHQMAPPNAAVIMTPPPQMMPSYPQM